MSLLNLEWHEDSANSQNFQIRRTSQDVFEEALAEELPVIGKILDSAFEMAMVDIRRYPPSFQLPSTKANRTMEFVRGLLFETFPSLMKTDGSRFFLEKDGYRVYFKKLRPDFKPMNNPTRNSRRIMQGQYTLFDDYRLVEVFVGYQTNKAKDDITGIYAVYFSHGELRWVTNLRGFGGDSGVMFPFVPAGNDPSPENLGLTVKPKKKQREESEII